MNTVHKLKPAEALAYYPYDGTTVKPIMWFVEVLHYGKIAETRKALGITQSELAYHMETSQNNISRIERKSFISVNDYNVLAYAIRYQNAYIHYRMCKEELKNG